MLINQANKLSASAIQKQFWIIQQIHPETSAYNVPSVFRVKGNLDVSILEKSINEVISRHGIFRTLFSNEGEELYQVVQPEMPLTVDVVDESVIT